MSELPENAKPETTSKRNLKVVIAGYIARAAVFACVLTYVLPTLLSSFTVSGATLGCIFGALFAGLWLLLESTLVGLLRRMKNPLANVAVTFVYGFLMAGILALMSIWHLGVADGSRNAAVAAGLILGVLASARWTKEG